MSIYGSQYGGLLDQSVRKKINPSYIAPVDPNAKPTVPEYLEGTQGARGPGYGLIQQEASQVPGSVTPWMKAQMGMQANAFGQAGQAARGAANQQAAGAASQMAMRGGLTGGARERLMQNRDQAATQGVAQAGQEYQRGLLDMGASADKNRLASISALNAADNTAMNRDLLMEQGRNAYNMNNYNSAMQAWAAGKTADAQLAALR